MSGAACITGPDYWTVQGNTRRSIGGQLQSPVGTPATNLLGATVVFHMVATDGSGFSIRGAAVIVDVPTAMVRYDWQPGDTATAGHYEAEFEVTYPDGSLESFGSAVAKKKPLKIEIRRALVPT